MKRLILALSACASISTFAESINPFNMAYVEVNDHKLSNVGCYIRADNGANFFHMVSIFAANINGKDPNQPVIYFNPQVDTLLNHTNQVDVLQKKGIKVLLTLLGNHENAGWACMTDVNAIQRFADEIVKTVNYYHLDGIDIDDEYSRCATNFTSMIKLTKAIKNHPGFKGKILSKALFSDRAYFEATDNGDKLADFLDYGWEMSYSYRDYANRLNQYTKLGMKKENLALGVSVNGFGNANAEATFIMKNNFGGVMVYNVGNNSQNYLSSISNVEYGTNVQAIPNCLG
ncbi:MAG: hypothetical protein ACD_46C00535G0003 [uncultured bacterium]|nr:MAG: hypothetical protein ACD_46C00535G0003 [uncultured bacterium]